MRGQHESTTPGNLAQMYYVRFYVAIVYQGLSEYGFLAVSGPEYGYSPEYVAEYSSMIVH